MHLQTEQLACALLLCCTNLCARFFLNDLAAYIAPSPPPHTHTGLGKRVLWRFTSPSLWDLPSCEVLSLLAVFSL